MRASFSMTMSRLPRGKACASRSSSRSSSQATPPPSTGVAATRSSLSSLRLTPLSSLAPSPPSRKQQQQRPLSSPPRSSPDEELEAQMEAFLKKQAEIEGSGSVGATATVELVADTAERAGARAGPGGDEGAVLGADVVSDDDAKRLCREVVDYVQTLRSSREMTVNEIRLTLAIESPLVREQRELLGVERGAGGVSRDDVAAALAAVAAGRVPRDRLALKELHREMSEWPFLKDAGGGGASISGKAGEGGMSGSSLARRARYGGAAAGAGGGGSSSSSSGWRRGQARPRMLGRDPSEEPQTLADRLPEWMGYGALYAISAIPVLIAGSVIAILFFNSLK